MVRVLQIYSSQQKSLRFYDIMINIFGLKWLAFAFVHSPASVVVVDLVVVVVVVGVVVVLVVVGSVVVVVCVVVVVLSLTTHSPCLQMQSLLTAQSTGNICWQSRAFSHVGATVVMGSCVHSPEGSQVHV